MIILDTVNRSLEIVLDAAPSAEFPFVASYVSVTASTYVPGTTTGVSNSTTAVTVVAAPGASTQRQIKLLTVRNGADASRILTLNYNDNTTLREIWKGTLDVGETLVYTDGEGLRVIDSSGSIKAGVQGPTGDPGSPGDPGPTGDTGPGATGAYQVWIDAASMVPRITNGPSRGFTEQGTNKNNHETLDFDTTTQEFAQFKWRMPKSWDELTVTFIPVWTAASGSGTVVFALQAVAVSNDDPLDVAFGTEQTSTDTLLAANDSHEGPQSSAITVGGTPVEGDLVTGQIKRNVADDTLGVDAKLLGIVLIITLNAANDA